MKVKKNQIQSNANVKQKGEWIQRRRPLIESAPSEMQWGRGGKSLKGKQCNGLQCKFKYSHNTNYPHPGSWEEDHVNVEAKGEEGDDGGGEQQDVHDQGQVRGSQGERWGQVQFQHCLQYEDQLNHLIRSMILSFSGKRCWKTESERWRRRKLATKMTWWSSCSWSTRRGQDGSDPSDQWESKNTCDRLKY